MYVIFIFYKIHYYSYLLKINIFTMSSAMDYIRKDFLTHVSPLQLACENTLFYTMCIYSNHSSAEAERCLCEWSSSFQPFLGHTRKEFALLHSQAHTMGKALFLGSSHLCLLSLPLNFGSSIFIRHTYSFLRCILCIHLSFL